MTKMWETLTLMALFCACYDWSGHLKFVGYFQKECFYQQSCGDIKNKESVSCQS